MSAAFAGALLKMWVVVGGFGLVVLALYLWNIFRGLK